VAQLQAFAKAQDLVIFVGGGKSSNAKVLYNHCLEANPKTIFVSSQDELEDKLAEYREQIQTNPDWKVGICGATSTPLWLMEKVRDQLTDFFQS
jgi:4-hydroxy-3-methylbut-2-enyl diphosphate reductase